MTSKTKQQMKEFEFKVPGGPGKVVVALTKYDENGRTAMLINSLKGKIHYKATINMPMVLLEEGEVIIKNYAENEGVLPFLVENNIVIKTGKVINTGFGMGDICILNPEELWGTPPAAVKIYGKPEMDFFYQPVEGYEPVHVNANMFEIRGHQILAEDEEQAEALCKMIEAIQS